MHVPARQHHVGDVPEFFHFEVDLQLGVFGSGHEFTQLAEAVPGVFPKVVGWIEVLEIEGNFHKNSPAESGISVEAGVTRPAHVDDSLVMVDSLRKADGAQYTIVLSQHDELFKSFPYQAEEQDLSEILTIGKTDISHHFALASRYSTKFGQFLQSLI